MRFLADENFNHDVVRGLIRVRPDLDLVRVQDVGLATVDDLSILAWAAQENRLVLTQDRATMPNFAYERMVVHGDAMTGLLVSPARMGVGQTIEEILLIAECSKQEEWNGRIGYLPL